MNFLNKHVRIVDPLNKDENRHLVLTSIEKFIENSNFDRIERANERWNRYFLWPQPILDFVSKYFDQLNLCIECRENFSSSTQICNSTDENDENDQIESQRCFLFFFLEVFFVSF